MLPTQLPSSLRSKKRALAMLDRHAARLAQSTSKMLTPATSNEGSTTTNNPAQHNIRPAQTSNVRSKKRALGMIERHIARSAPSTTSNEIDQLHHRLCNLPPELYCMIKDLTLLTVELNQIITVGPGYRPPVQLQIDKALRRTAGQKFYSTNTFTFHAHPKITPPKGASASDEKIERPFATYMAWNCSLYRSHSMIIHVSSHVAFSADGELQIRLGIA